MFRYQRAPVIVLSIFDWALCMISMLVLQVSLTDALEFVNRSSSKGWSGSSDIFRKVSKDKTIDLQVCTMIKLFKFKIAFKSPNKFVIYSTHLANRHIVFAQFYLLTYICMYVYFKTYTRTLTNCEWVCLTNSSFVNESTQPWNVYAPANTMGRKRWVNNIF